MPLKTPKFWHHKNWLAYLLLPFSYLYLCGHILKSCLTKTYKSTIPVICVGGVVAGGSGKTPVVHAIVKIIRQNNLYINPVILTRGYGGRLNGPTLVDPMVHESIDVGDEALLHATHTPTIVSGTRDEGARLAEAMGADVIIMDDGLQNNSLEKDLSLLVLDARQGIGNGFMLPAGPLREPLAEALSKSACIVQTNGKADPHFDKPILSTAIRILSNHDKSKEFFAFAGIGQPEKFRLTLEENGFKMAGFKFFADHHAYTPRDMERLKRQAGDQTLITTQKDFVRIPKSYINAIDVLVIEQYFDHPEKIISFIKETKA